MLSNAYFLAKFRFDTAENEPAKNLQNFRKCLFENAFFENAFFENAFFENAFPSQTDCSQPLVVSTHASFSALAFPPGSAMMMM